MTLESSQALEGGAMLLRYRIQNADIQAAIRTPRSVGTGAGDRLR
jgi:hypothetical protein